MSSKLAEVLGISLEDYIAKNGIVSSLRPKPNVASEPGYFKRPMRSEIDDDENDDCLFIEDRKGVEMEAEDVEDAMPPLIRELPRNGDQIQDEEWKPANVSIQLDSDRECRSFITEEKKRGITHMPSQQWRLRRENQVSKKPIGVPPLISVKSVFDQNTEQLIASLGENAKFHNDDARDLINQRLQNSKRQWNNNRNNNNQNRNNNNQNRNNNNQNRNNNNRNRNYGNRNRNYGDQNRNYGYQNRNNNNRNQYGKNPEMLPSFNPTVNRIEQRNSNQIRDLRPFITPPSSMQSQATAVGSLVPNGPWNPPTQFGQPQLVTFADMLNQIGKAADNQNRETFADVIRNVMRNQQQPQQQQQSPASGVPLMSAENFSRMNSTDLMPFAAQTLLNHITTVQQNFGPKYDMKLQKDIHALQGKSLLYRSNGVVSMDGPGVEGDLVKPVSTDLSMNMRFS